MDQENSEKYPLDETSIEMFNEIKQQSNALNEQFRGALTLFMRQHKLQGIWRVAENGRELEKVNQQPVNVSQTENFS